LANRAASITVFVTGSSTAAVLLALCGSTAIITSPFMNSSSLSQGYLARRAMQLPAEQTSLEPLPRRGKQGRAAGRS
jgi:hypothetical protein